jgi:hypothetical protein
VARKLIVELIADPRGYTAGLQTAAKQTKLFGAETEAMTAKVNTSVKGLGRSLALATGGFVAFEGVSRFLEDSVNAARDAGVAQRSLAAQIKASGDSFAGNQAAVQKAELSLEKYGFTSEDSAKALTVLERGTGNITRAISLQGVAANLARAKNIDLASAANVLAKVFGGQETALRRAVPGLDKNAHGLQLIADAQQRLAGQAKAGTTEAEKFHAILHNTEVIVGTALLPTLNKYLGELGKWLDKMNRSGQLQKDVNSAVKTATGLFEDLKAIVGPLADAFKTLGDMVGGTKNELKLLVSALLTFKGVKLLSGLAGIGSTAKTATGEVTGLRGALLGLNTLPVIGPIVIGVTVDEAIHKQRESLEKKLGPFGALLAGPEDIYNALKTAVSNVIKGPFGGPSRTSGLQGPLGTPTRGGLSGLRGPILPTSVSGIPSGVSGIANYALTAAQQRAIGLAGDPNNLGLLRQQAAADQAALEFAKKLRSSGTISNAKYVTEVTGYATDLQQRNATIAGILQTARQKTLDAAKAAAEKTKAAAEAARQHAVAVAQLAVTVADATPGYQDDLATRRHLVEILKKQLAADKENVDLQNQLFDAEQAVQAKLKERADAAKQAKLDAGQLAIARAGLTTSLQDNLTAELRYLQILRVTKATALDIVNEQQTIQGIRNQIQQQNEEARKQAADDRRTRLETRQYRALGLGPGGADLPPGLKALRQQFFRARELIKGTILDTKANKSLFAGIAQDLSGRFGTLGDEILSKIKGILDGVDTQLENHIDDLKGYRQVSSQAFIEALGLDLTGTQKRRLEIALAQLGPRNTLPTASGQFSYQTAGAAGVTITGPVHIHGVQDLGQFEDQITKRHKARPHVRRGAT